MYASLRCIPREGVRPGLVTPGRRRSSNWLSSEENRQEKRHASIVFAVDNAEQAQKAIKKKLYIAEIQLVAESYKSAETKTQCQKCQRLEHSTRHCINQEYCQICAEKHYTKHHKCHICQIVRIECSHSKLKCRNCDENHKFNSQIRSEERRVGKEYRTRW